VLPQAELLGDSRFSSAQRRTIAIQIENVLGNQHLQTTLGSLNSINRTNQDVLQRTHQTFDRRRQAMGIAPGYPIEPLPAGREDRREGALYYDDSEDDLEAMCIRDAGAERFNVQGRGSYIIGYRFYRIYFVFGRGAIQRDEGVGAGDDPGESLVAMYRHEREHQRQYQAIRGVDQQIARENRERSERLGRFSSPETISRITAEMIPIDPEIWGRHTRTEHLTSVRAERTRGITETGGMDLTNRANLELSAHTMAFTQTILRSLGAALEQLRPLCAVVPQMGTTPRWSYDMADQNVKDETARGVLGAIWRTQQPVVTLNEHVIPALEEVESNERSRQRSPTSFLQDLRATCRTNPEGYLEPADPETALRHLRGRLFQ
jgi:hypothetical protein